MDSKHSRRISQKQEKSFAKKLNGKATVASGALWSAKGDVRSDQYLAECKVTEKEQYSLKFSIWEKIQKEALRDGIRIPLLEIQIQDKRYTIFNNNESRFKADKNFNYKVTTLYQGRDSILLKKSLLTEIINEGLAESSITVIRIVREKEVLALMETDDFTLCLSLK